MPRFPKFETTRERHGKPSGIFACAYDHVVDNTIMATNPGRGGGG